MKLFWLEIKYEHSHFESAKNKTGPLHSAIKSCCDYSGLYVGKLEAMVKVLDKVAQSLDSTLPPKQHDTSADADRATAEKLVAEFNEADPVAFGYKLYENYLGVPADSDALSASQRYFYKWYEAQTIRHWHNAILLVRHREATPHPWHKAPPQLGPLGCAAMTGGGKLAYIERAQEIAAARATMYATGATLVNKEGQHERAMQAMSQMGLPTQ
jgi:hypothetical protein